jgi:hypothetical protein
MRYLITWPNRDQQILCGYNIHHALLAGLAKGEVKLIPRDNEFDWISEDEYPGEFDEFLRKSGGKLFLKYEYDNG